jgi:hypothetical protein
MAGMRKKGDGYHCTFRFRGKRYYFAAGNLTEPQANAKGSEVDETLDLIERGRLTVPEGSVWKISSPLAERFPPLPPGQRRSRSGSSSIIT